MGLTKTDLAALRRADSVVFSYRPTAGGESDHCIRAVKRADSSDPFAQDVSYQIGASGSIRLYAHGHAQRAVYVLGYAKVTPEWVTIARFLREGDELSLRWVADNNSPLIEKAGLHADELSLDVTRVAKSPTGKSRLYVFSIGYEVCTANTARMIEVAGWRYRTEEAA